jgi:fumarate hydratase class II
MPGQVNPTQGEALAMLATQVLANDVAVSIAGASGNFQLNVMKPVLAANFLQSVRLLADGMRSFDEHCARGIQPNLPRIDALLRQSLMLVTALVPKIGYDKAAHIAKHAHKHGLTLRAAALELGLVSGQDFDAFVNPAHMVGDLAKL